MTKFTKLSISIGLIAFVGIFSLISNQPSNASSGYIPDNPTQSVPERSGPPWLDAVWHYRRPITINNSADLPSYQVLIELNNVNFPSFNLTNPDGSDLRITDSDGTTELPFWVESWNTSTQKGYVWFKIIRLTQGDTTVYLYYGNPSASSKSNGSGTFDYFDDDWSGIPPTQGKQGASFPEVNNEILSPFTWETFAGVPQVVPPGNLSLAQGTGIKSTDILQPRALGFKAMYGLNGDHLRVGFLIPPSGPGTSVGDDCPGWPGDLFLINGGECAAFVPDGAWHNVFHVYEVRWKSGQTVGAIDHGISGASSNAQVPSGPLPVTLYSYPDSGATLLVDWAYVRQYRDPEPAVTVGSQQGLVDLKMNMQDSPDPLPKNNELTYQLSVHNDSFIDAIGVIVTDTLPANVQFISSSPLGCSHNDNHVVCNLNTVEANAIAYATIVVKPTLDGVITNNVMVDSLGYELDGDWSDNASQEQTLVDSIPPNVNWQIPVQNGEKYTTGGGLVALEASAADNDQVAWVEFWYWDHLPIDAPRGKITIGKDYTFPFEWQFNSDSLVPFETYQMFVQAADRAGNISDYHTQPYPVLYMERILINYIFLPIAAR